MKDKLLKIYNAKKEQKEKLAVRAKSVETAEELRSINNEIELLNNEMQALDDLIREADQREQEITDMEHRYLANQNRETNDATEYRAIAKILLNRQVTDEERALVTLADNGAVLPEDFINDLQLLRKGFPALKPYCHVISVTKHNGKMPFAKIGNNKLSNLTSGEKIPEGNIGTENINYSVDDYGKLLTVENSLTDDEVVGIIQNIVKPEFAEASVLTENDAILDIVKAEATEIGGAEEYTDVENAMNAVLPSLRAGIVVLTNLSGYVYLKSKKDALGRDLNLVTNVNGQDIFNGKTLITLDDANLPATAGKVVFYVVNMWALVKFFDRKGYEVATSKEALFAYNQTAIRVLERFDIQKLDNRACKKIEFTPKAGAPNVDASGLTVVSAVGSAAGKTKLTVAPEKEAENTYKYKTADKVDIPLVAADLTSWTDWDGTADIAATTGNVICIAEVDVDKRCVKAGKTTVTAKV